MTTKVESQLALDEQQIENAELEEALEDRLSRKNSASELNRQYQEAHEKVVGLLEAAKIEVPEDGAIRIGRFRLTKAITKARSVSFETDEKARLKIDFDDDE